MFLSDTSVRRPIAMSCLIIGLSFLGIQAGREMTLELLPKMDAPMITITTVYPGASPEQIETDVAKRIEDQVVSVDGLKHVDSTCMEDACLTFLEFTMGVDIDVAATDVREKLDLVRGDFPVAVEDPVVAKFDVNATPVVRLALTGDLPLEEIYDYADNTLKDRITTLGGVAECRLIGGAKREVQVILDHDRLAARGLSSADVAPAVRESLGRIPAGRLRDRGMEYSVEFDADYDTVEGLNDLVVRVQDGRRVYVRDIGSVRMGTEELRQRALIDGRPCVAIEVVKKAEANAVEVVAAVRDSMGRLQATLPGGLELRRVQDDGRFIAASVESAWINIVQGILLTAFILFLFLYNVRSTLVVSVTMPLTIVIGLFFMQFLGYSLNMSTLIAIGLSVGILVTNSIVVLEAIVRELGAGHAPEEAARRGASASWLPVLASAGTNVVVLFPIALVEGLVGPFLRALVLTMLILTVVSLFISFTLTPMLCAALLRSRKDTGWLRRVEDRWNRGLGRVVAWYRALLTLLERRRWLAGLLLGGVALLLIGSLGLATRVGGSFFPEPDKGEITVRLEFPTAYSLAKTEARVLEVDRRLSDLPELQSRLVTMGKIQGIAGQASEGVNLAQVQLKFSERDLRDLSLPELLGLTRERLSGMTDCLIGVYIPSIIGGINAPIQLLLAGADLEVLDGLVGGVQSELVGRPGYAEIDTSVREGKPKLRVTPRRAVLSDLAMPASALGMALRGNLEGLPVGTYKRGDRNYDIVVKLAEVEGKRQVDEFLFPGGEGRPLLITALGEVEETTTPVQILRRDKRRVARLTGTVADGMPLGRAVTEVTTLMGDGRLPAGYGFAFAGDVEYMAEMQRELGSAALTAMVLVVLCLAAILESWRQPALILITVPLGWIGIVWALFLGGESFSVFVVMGAVMLIGIVVNNAILIIDQFNQHVREGHPRHRAMIEAAADRLRPILMISIAAVLGMLPLALGSGIGAELRNGVGLASVGGILFSGILTMLVLPVLYDFFTRRKNGKPGGAKRRSAAVGLLLLLTVGLAGSEASASSDLSDLSDLAAVSDQSGLPILKLEEARRLALLGNPGLGASQARVEAAAAAVRQARASYYPTLGLTAGARHNGEVPALGGGSSPYEHYTAQAYATWLIFDGFSRRFTLLAAEHGKDVDEAADQDARRLLLQAVAEGYLAALLSQEEARVAEQDARFNQDLFEETQKRQAAGSASRSDVLNFRMRTLRAESALLVIRRQYDTAMTALAALLGQDRARLQVRIDPSAAQVIDVRIPSSEEAIDYALVHRPDVRQYEAASQLGAAVVKAQQGRYFPSVVVEGGYGLNQAAGSDVFDRDQDAESYVGIRANWDLFTGGSRQAQVDWARAQTDSLAWQLKDVRIRVAAEVRDALNSVHTAERALDNQVRIAQMTEEIRDIVVREYEVGLASLVRLNEVQTDAVRGAGNLALAWIERARALEALSAATARNLEPGRFGLGHSVLE